MEVEPRAQCVECVLKLSNEALKPLNLNRHLEATSSTHIQNQVLERMKGSPFLLKQVRRVDGRQYSCIIAVFCALSLEWYSTRGHAFLRRATNSNYCPGMLSSIYVENGLQPQIQIIISIILIIILTYLNLFI